MFGFSLGKLLVFLALVVVSWGLLSHRFRKSQNGERQNSRRQNMWQNFSKKEPQDKTFEADATLILCKKCTTYHVEGECSKHDGS